MEENLSEEACLAGLTNFEGKVVPGTVFEAARRFGTRARSPPPTKQSPPEQEAELVSQLLGALKAIAGATLPSKRTFNACSLCSIFAYHISCTQLFCRSLVRVDFPRNMYAFRFEGSYRKRRTLSRHNIYGRTFSHKMQTGSYKALDKGLHEELL